MEDTTTGAAREPLRFDATSSAPEGGAGSAPQCSRCATPIGAYYYESAGAVYCARCKRQAEETAASLAGAGGFGRAALYGLGAALLGGFGYWLFMKLTEMDWALVSVGVAVLVASAIRKGKGGRSGRRFQLLAAALTYFAIGAAYSPLIIEGMRQGARQEATAAADSTGTSAGAAARDEAEDEEGEPTLADSAATVESAQPSRASATPTWAGFALLAVLLGVIVIALAGPVIAIVAGGFPGALINIAIVGFALHRAWHLAGAEGDAATTQTFTGPYKVGGERSAG